MPFKSKKQWRWMFANDPAMAKRWAAHTPSIKDLPNRVEDTEEKKGFHMSSVATDVLVNNVASITGVSPAAIGILAEKVGMDRQRFAAAALHDPGDYADFLRVFAGAGLSKSAGLGTLTTRLLTAIKHGVKSRAGVAGGVAAGAGGLGYAGAQALSGGKADSGPVQGSEPSAAVPTPEPQQAQTPPQQSITDTKPVSRGNLSPMQKGLIGAGAVGAGAVGAGALMRRKKNKEVTASATLLKTAGVRQAVLEKVGEACRSIMRSRFAAACDELYDRMPSEKRASLRVLSEVIRDGKPLGYAMKLAYPHLSGFNRGILADRLCKYAAEKYRTVKREEATAKVCNGDAAKVMSKMADEKTARSFSRA